MWGNVHTYAHIRKEARRNGWVSYLSLSLNLDPASPEIILPLCPCSAEFADPIQPGPAFFF